MLIKLEFIQLIAVIGMLITRNFRVDAAVATADDASKSNEPIVDHSLLQDGGNGRPQLHQMQHNDVINRLSKLITVWDVDKDGFIDRDELYKWILHNQRMTNEKDDSRALKTVDRNGDSVLTPEEYIETHWEMGLDDVKLLRQRAALGKGRGAAHNSQEEYVLGMVEDFLHRFQAADENGDGRLDLIEFRTFNHPSENPRVAIEEVKRQMPLHDKNGDGKVSKLEFIGVGPSLTKTFRQFREQEFQLYDLDNSAFLEIEEIRKWLLPTVEELSSKEANDLLQEGDADRDGRLSSKEMLAIHRTLATSQLTNYGEQLRDEL